MHVTNISNITSSGLCHGCGVCAGVCPAGAIGFTEVTDEIQPIIDPSVCTECGLCAQVCSGGSVDFKQLADAADISHQHYAPALGYFEFVTLGWAKDPEIRWRGSSGGVITAVLIHALEEDLIDGALVVRMRPTSQGLRAEGFIARSSEDLLSAIGSKYVQVPLGSGLQEILRCKGHYAVVGLPCAIESLRKAEQLLPELRQRIVVYLGMACGANLNMKANQFIVERVLGQPVPLDAILDIQYRGSGWPGVIRVQTRDGVTKTIGFKPTGDFLFTLHLFQVKRCYMCIDHVAELADISLGDAWLPRIMDDDHLGTSFAVVRTPRGKALWKRTVADRVLEIGSVSIREVIRSQRFTLYTKKIENPLLIRINSEKGKPIPDYRYYGTMPLLDIFRPGLSARIGIKMKHLTALLSKRGYPGILGRIPDSIMWLGLVAMAGPVFLNESRLYREVQ